MFSDRTKENIVIILSIIGFLFILISTINFVYKIPNLDKEIAQNEEKIKISQLNHLLFQIYQSNEHSLANQIKVLYEINPNSTRLIELYDELRMVKRISMEYMYADITGDLVNETNKKEWSELDYAQLQKEEDILSTISPATNEIRDSLNKLNSDKDNLLFWSTLYQVIGLFITQLAILLQFRWFNLQNKETSQ